MSSVDWLGVLGWSSEELDDIRCVGYAYIKQGVYEIALTFFEALIVFSKDNPYDYQTLGALYLEKGEYLKSLNTLEQALRIEPNHGPTLLNRVKALLALGYKRQGLHLAKQLEKHENSLLSNQASALILAYT